MFRWRLWILLLDFVLIVRGHFSIFGAPYEDDFVDVEFSDCKKCEQNYRNMVFLLKRPDDNEQAAMSVYSMVMLIMWICLGVLEVLQRWAKMKIGAYHVP